MSYVTSTSYRSQVELVHLTDGEWNNKIHDIEESRKWSMFFLNVVLKKMKTNTVFEIKLFKII